MESYSKRLDTVLSCDVAVVGSGSAGSTAAIAAAATGARTTLIERYGFLGGTSTMVLDTFYGFYTPGTPRTKVVGGVPDLVLEHLASGVLIWRGQTLTEQEPESPIIPSTSRWSGRIWPAAQVLTCC